MSASFLFLLPFGLRVYHDKKGFRLCWLRLSLETLRACNDVSSPFTSNPEAALLRLEDASSSAHAMSSWDHHPNQTHEPAHGMMSSNAHPYGYTSEAPPVPLPPDAQSYPQGEAYPLQAEIQQTASSASYSHFQGGCVTSPVRSSESPYGDGSRLPRIPTEPPAGILLQWHCWSCESRQYGNIDSWAQATQLANYWRRYFKHPQSA